MCKLAQNFFMEFEGTKGVWQVDESNPTCIAVLIDGVFKYICEVEPSSFSKSDSTTEENEANARLIAAAPEMLEALHNNQLVISKLAGITGGRGIGKQC